MTLKRKKIQIFASNAEFRFGDEESVLSKKYVLIPSKTAVKQ